MDRFIKTRKDFYAFLYRMYLEEPPRELAEDLVNKNIPIPEQASLNDDMLVGFNLLKEYMDRSTDVEEVYERLRDEYTRLFLGPITIIKPYESVYRRETGEGASEKTAILLKLKEDYRKAGVSKSKMYKEPADHIAFELKFMHYLCEEELKALGDEARMRNCLTLQREFMGKHVLAWVPNLCDDLYQNKQSDFYKCIAKITKGFLSLDSELINEVLE